MEITLGENRFQVALIKVLERRNPAFDGITTGVVVQKDFYYIANQQTDNAIAVKLRPLQVFSVAIDR